MNRLQIQFQKLAINISKYDTAFKDIGDAGKALVKSILGGMIAPIGVGICLVILVFKIVRIAQMKKRGHGDEISDEVPTLIILFLCMILLSTLSAWGWNLL